MAAAVKQEPGTPEPPLQAASPTAAAGSGQAGSRKVPKRRQQQQSEPAVAAAAGSPGGIGGRLEEVGPGSSQGQSTPTPAARAGPSRVALGSASGSPFTPGAALVQLQQLLQRLPDLSAALAPGGPPLVPFPVEGQNSRVRCAGQTLWWFPPKMMKQGGEFRLGSLSAQEWLQLVQGLLQMQQSDGVDGVVIDLEAWGLTAAGLDSGAGDGAGPSSAAQPAPGAAAGALPGSWERLCSCSQVTLRRRDYQVIVCKLKQLSPLLQYEGWSLLCGKPVSWAGQGQGTAFVTLYSKKGSAEVGGAGRHGEQGKAGATL